MVLYSIGSMMWATRFWWMLRSLGFDDAAVLDGGLDKWKAEGRPIESGGRRAIRRRHSRPCRARASSLAAAPSQAAIGNKGMAVVNALGPQFHKGLEPSRYGRPGRIPGSVNVPAATLVSAKTKDFTSLADAAAKFEAQGVTKDKKVIAYCGGGISATIDLFLLHQLGYDNLTLYDGSMGEWAKDPRCPSRRVEVISPQSLPRSFLAAISRLHAAMAKVANGDNSAIKALYAHSDDATSFYGWGGYEKGWDAVSKRWDWAGQQFKGGTVSYQNVTAVTTAELAYTTDIETFQVRMDGMDQPTQWSTGSPTSSASRAANGGCYIATPTAWKTSTSRRRACSRRAEKRER